MADVEERNVLSVDFNYDASYFTLGLTYGFALYKAAPVSHLFTRKFSGGLKLVKMLCKSNIFGLVGGGKSPAFPLDKLIFWDDKKNNITKQFRFNAFITNLYMKKKMTFVLTDNELKVISLENYSVIEQYSTVENDLGISAISNSMNKYIFAFPDNEKINKICVRNFSKPLNLTESKLERKKVEKKEKNEGNFSDEFEVISDKEINQIKDEMNKDNDMYLWNVDESIDLLNEGKIVKINAHKSSIYRVGLNYEGTKLCTCSPRGTFLRIFDTKNGNFLMEFNRGVEPTLIDSLAFNCNSTFLAATSEKGTMHLFVLKSSSNSVKDKALPENKQSYFGIKSFLQYGISTKAKSIVSFLDFAAENKKGNKILVFDFRNIVQIVSFDGYKECEVVSKDEIKFYD